MGKTVITTELGGGGRVPAFVHQLAWNGLTNVLRHLGVLKGEVQTRESLGLPPAIIIDGRDPANYVNTDEAGFWENLLEPGDKVRQGEPVGRLWFPEQPERGPRVFTAPMDGILTVVRAMTPTLAGDSIFVTGQPIEACELL
jgi:predicted deacylase